MSSQDRKVCSDCGALLPDADLIAAAERAHMILPAHELIHMCPVITLLRPQK